MTIRLQVRKDDLINWTTTDPELLQGEIAFELDTGKMKIGRVYGAKWSETPYLVTSTGSILISSVSGLETALSDINTALGDKADSVHGHTEADIVGLTVALSGKAASTHNHAVADLNTTGTASSTTYLNGAGAWAPVPNKYGTIVALGDSTGTVNLDASAGDIFTFKLTGAVTLTISNLPTPPYMALLKLEQDATGSRLVTWNSVFKHADATAPTLATVGGSINWFLLNYVSANRVEVFKSDGSY